MQNDITYQIKQRISIVDEVREKVKLTKKGKNYLGLCPFHNEKTPSFNVDEIRGMFHCFGCNTSGDVFEFVMKSKHWSFVETLEYLAAKANVVIPKHQEDPSNKQKVKDLYLLMEAANNWFVNNLFMQSGKEALAYLTARALNKATLTTFQLGYAPSNKDSLFKYLLNEGFSEEDIIAVGLRGVHENGNYDVFRNRVIFPIKSKAGKIIAFGGRALKDSDSPKYLNSKDTVLFHKKHNLYGFSEAVQNLAGGNIILVEGYIDVIALYQHGIKTAVAPLGTAVSKEQLLIITKIDKSPVICLDGDLAGRKASNRVANIFLEIIEPKMLPKFIFLSEKEDPDSFISKHGKAEFLKIIEKGVLLSGVIWQIINPSEEDLSSATPEIKALTLAKVNEYCDLINEQSIKQEFLKFFKEKLANNQNNRFSFKDSEKTKVFLAKEALKNTVSVDYNEITGYFLLAYVINCPQIYDKVDQKFATLLFNDEKLEELKQQVVELLNEQEYNKDDLINILAEKGFNTILNNIMQHKVIALTVRRLNNVNEFLSDFEETYNIFLLKSLRQEMTSIKNQLQHYVLEGHKPELLLKKLEALHAEINEIKYS